MVRSTKYIPITLLVFFLSAPYSSYALSISSFTPFGGKVLYTMPCTCAYTAWMTPRIVAVGTPRPGTFIQTIFTRLYSNYMVLPGKNVLGLASKTRMPCMMQAGYVCTTYGTYDFMYMIGTGK